MSDELPYDFSNCDMKTYAKTGRKSGFYWCRYLGVWKICEWESSGQWWNIPGFDNNTIFEDQNFAEIDERPIEREVKPLPEYRKK